MTQGNSKIVRLDSARDDTSSFAPQYLIATVGLCLAALPIIDGLPFGSAAWISAFGGGGAVVLAIGSAIRPRCWQACAQGLLGCTVAVVPVTMPSSSICDSVAALCGGIVIGLSALTHIAELQRARERDRHRGWRSASRPASRGPRLVYSADRGGRPAYPDRIAGGEHGKLP